MEKVNSTEVVTIIRGVHCAPHCNMREAQEPQSGAQTKIREKIRREIQNNTIQNKIMSWLLWSKTCYLAVTTLAGVCAPILIGVLLEIISGRCTNPGNAPRIILLAILESVWIILVVPRDHIVAKANTRKCQRCLSVPTPDDRSFRARYIRFNWAITVLFFPVAFMTCRIYAASYTIIGPTTTFILSRLAINILIISAMMIWLFGHAIESWIDVALDELRPKDSDDPEKLKGSR